MGVGKLFVVSAPSGAGKTSLVNAALQNCGTECLLSQVVTFTTRPPREGEVNGVEYNFITVDEFKSKIDQEFFLEWSTFYDHYYGSPHSIITDIEKNGRSYIVVVDRSGAKEIFASYPQAVLIWIEPPSIRDLESRLKMRGKDTPTTIQTRMNKATVEMEEEREQQFYTYHFINDDFEKTVKELCDLFKKELKKSA